MMGPWSTASKRSVADGRPSGYDFRDSASTTAAMVESVPASKGAKVTEARKILRRLTPPLNRRPRFSTVIIAPLGFVHHAFFVSESSALSNHSLGAAFAPLSFRLVLRAV
jgi:hypothetical protein